MKTTVTNRWQITIPKPLRKQLGLRPGQVLDVRAERGHLVATKPLRLTPSNEFMGFFVSATPPIEFLPHYAAKPMQCDYRRRHQRASTSTSK